MLKLPMFKKNKNSTTPPPPDSDVEDDLFAQLDLKDKASELSSVSKSPEPRTENRLQKPKKDSKLKFKAREARKAMKLQSSHRPTDTAADARLEQEAKNEERDIKRVCDQLGLDMFEISPDGHCLFAAVADQLVIHGLMNRSSTNYASTRLAAANYMLSHQDDFIPFLPSVEGEDGVGATQSDGIMSSKQYARYCASIRETAAWGGEPEILALSRAYNVPIHVVQAGKPPVVIHEPVEGMSDVAGAKVAFISYHRRMYGLGEHYNSLRPRIKAQQVPTAFMTMSMMH